MLNAQKILAAINALNSPPIPLTLDNVVVSDPQPSNVQPYPGAIGWNTKITASAKPDLGYANSVEVYYHRIGLEELGTIELLSNYEFTPENVVNLLNNIKGTELALEDLEQFVIPEMAEVGDVANIAIAAKERSIGWINTNTVLLGYNIPDNLNKVFETMNVTLPNRGYLR